MNNKKIEQMTVSKNDINFKPGFIEQANQIINILTKKKSNLPSSDDIFLTYKLIKKIF